MPGWGAEGLGQICPLQETTECAGRPGNAGGMNPGSVSWVHWGYGRPHREGDGGHDLSLDLPRLRTTAQRQERGKSCLALKA